MHMDADCRLAQLCLQLRVNLMHMLSILVKVVSS